MSAREVALKRLPHGADLALPGYATELSAGIDLLAAVEAGGVDAWPRMTKEAVAERLALRIADYLSGAAHTKGPLA